MLGLRHFRGSAIDLFLGDISSFVCDAIVNAANEGLRGGGGVDGAIHRAGGPSILEECRRIGHCPSGTAVITTAGDLPCSKVIHTVGPIWQGGEQEEAETLQKAYRSCLILAAEFQLRHLAFPSISTGAYGYPLEKAAPLALAAIREYLETKPPAALRRISFVLYDRSHYSAYQQALFQVFPEHEEDQT